MEDKLINRILIVIIILIAFIFLINYIVLSFYNLIYPFDIMYDEGGYFLGGLLIYEGNFSSVYKSIYEEPKFYINIIPPFFYILEAAFFAIFSPSLFAGRLISIVSLFLSFILVFLIIKKLLKDKLTSLALALLIFTNYLVFFWTPINRHDSLVSFLSLLGIYFVMQYKKKSSINYATISFLLALFTRQTVAFSVLISFVYLLMKNKKKANEFLLKIGISSISVFILLNMMTNWHFYEHITEFNSLFGNEHALNLVKGFIYDYFLIISLVVISFIKERKNLLNMLAVTYLLVGILLTFKVGAWVQHLYDFIIFFPLGIAVLYKRANLERKNMILTIIIIHIILIAHNYTFLTSIYSNVNQYTAFKNYNSDLELYKIVSYEENNVLLDHRFIGFLAGKRYLPELFGFVKLNMLGKITEQNFKDLIDEKNISLIIYRGQYENYNIFNNVVRKNFNLTKKLLHMELNNINLEEWNVMKRK